MANVAAVLETQKSLETMLMRRMTDLEAQLHTKTTSPKEDKDKLTLFQEEFNSFKVLVISIFKLLRQQISEILKAVDTMETRQRQKCLLFSGVPEKSEENLSVTVVTLFQRHLGLTDVSNNCVKTSYRLGRFIEGRTRPIVVQFSNITSRSLVWKNKTKFKGSSLVLHEFLTKERQAAFKTARDHFGVNKVWTSNGTVCISTPDNSVVRLISLDELNKVITKFPRTSPVAGALDVEPSQILKPVQTRAKRVNKNVK
ncbi:unnamed protein product [Diatraea saccharalis]|uniref:Uncharacterized protein n=1 Tax=Diatraea saccharalis TaxID=40085 RepID=A0A9N9N534_9NEOP|nr:unnamed protein product [Diatraea saccharalis]